MFSSNSYQARFYLLRKRTACHCEVGPNTVSIPLVPQSLNQSIYINKCMPPEINSELSCKYSPGLFFIVSDKTVSLFSCFSNFWLTTNVLVLPSWMWLKENNVWFFWVNQEDRWRVEMNSWVDEWLAGWLAGKMDKWIDKWLSGWTERDDWVEG